MYDTASVIATAIVLPLLASVAVCLRFFVRIRLTRSHVGIDDWLIAVSCILLLGLAALQIAGTYHLFFRTIMSKCASMCKCM